jgi:ATP-dependent helicase HrpA
VQRLPIERVSQASADQRKGRCGRVAEGVCIRLYSEDDFAERARFTDPEILRTNLASVILQMAAIGLGDIAQFPFLDPPDARQIRDGVNLLTELGALDGDRLTQTGRRLAQLPVDPRLARMVLEANHLSCADEVIVIAAALSIQDPRERPQEKQAQADQLHARFKDESSDFVAYLNLWRHLRTQQAELSGNQFRKRCQAEFLHYLRVREWQDLVAQLRAAARGADVTINREPAEVPQIHMALLAGLLSHIGVRDERRPREYVGARNARFAIFPGSGLAKKPPAWVMVAELVETSRLWGRVGARIDPKWVEPLAGHLLKRQYSEPRWDRKRAAVVATERVTLYGLPIVAGRSVAYGRIDPALSRDLFLRRALVEGDWDTRHHFVRDNEAMIEEVRALEERARRRDILVDDQVLYDFYAARIPEKIISGAHFDRWWRDERKRDPALLNFTQELLIAPAAADALDDPGRPSVWRQSGQELQLSYRFDPTSAHDGVTVHVPLRLLGELRPTGFDWLVPSLRPELVTELIRSLPKDVRRQLVPVPDTAAEVVAGLRPRRGPIVDQVAALLGSLRGVQVEGSDFAVDALPSYLRMTFRVEDEDGTVLGEGQDLGAVRAGLQQRLRAELGAASAGLEQDGLTSWTLGELPREVSLPGAGNAVKAYPALVDQGDSVGVRVLDSPGTQASAMWAGTRRLLLLTSPSPLKFVQSRLSPAAQLTLAAAPHHNLSALVDDAAVAAVDVLLAQAGGPAWDAAGFARLRDHVAGHLVDETSRVVADVVRVLDARRTADRALEDTPITTPQEARLDVATQLGRLVFPGFIAATGAARLPDVVRYLQGAAKRLERLPTQPGPDLDRMRSVHELEALYRARVDSIPRDRPLPAALREVPWMLEELRLSHFAQGVGVKGPVSAKRIRQAIATPA